MYETIHDNSAHGGPHRRYTTLFHTVVDVLISAFSFSFHGSMGSSLSELKRVQRVKKSERVNALNVEMRYALYPFGDYSQPIVCLLCVR